MIFNDIQCVPSETSFTAHGTVLDKWILMDSVGEIWTLTLDNTIFCVMVSRKRQTEFHKLIMTIAQHSDLQPRLEITGTQSVLHNCHQPGAFALKRLWIDNTFFSALESCWWEGNALLIQSMRTALQLRNKLRAHTGPYFLPRRTLTLSLLEKWAHQPWELLSSTRRICLACYVVKCVRPTSADGKGVVQFRFC